MGDIVSFPTSFVDNFEFVTDLARFRENLLDEKAIRKKYRLADDVWKKLGDDDELIRAVEAESIRRIRDGSVKREKAQQLVVQAPDVVGGILLDVSASPKHRLDAAKILDTFSANTPESTPVSDRFIIQINLGDDVLRFNKSLKPDVTDVDPHHPEDAPQGLLTTITTEKKRDDQW